MRKLILLTIMILTLTIPSGAYAGQGQAFMPGMMAYNYSPTIYKWRLSEGLLHNITDHTLSGEIVVFGMSGNIVHDDNSPSTGDIKGGGFATYSESTGTGSYTINFTIAPRATAWFGVFMDNTPDVDFMGHAVIRWKNLEGDDDAYGLIATGINNFTNKYEASKPMAFERGITINGGMPF
ncbi:MAG: hypothetical protein V6Z89_15180 [Desulfobacter sp.]